ncbi:MAG: hypothetical protein GX855_07855 [Firmicutes bacterium]|nr:hypothetical protein [Bacillota bacterium]
MDSYPYKRSFGWMVAILTALVLLASGVAAAAEESGGEELPILRFGTTARVWGMGNAGVAAARGVEGLYYNPAALASVVQPELSISHSTLGEATDLSFAAAALPITDRGSLGAGFLLLSSSGIPRTKEESEEPIGTFDYLQAVAYISTGMEIAKGCSAGLTVKGIFGEVDDAHCRGYSLEGGLRQQVNDVLTIGFLARDVIGEMNWSTGLVEELPTQVLGGATLSLLDGKLLVSGQTDSKFKDWGVGAEYNIGGYLQLRGGYVEDSITAGAGLGFGHIQVDYTWTGRESGGTHRVSFGVRF